MARVYKRGGSYWIRFTYPGQEVRQSARTASKATAQQFLAHAVEERRILDRGGRQRRTFQPSSERFVAEHFPTLKPSTQRRYRVSLKQLQPAFGRLHIDEINKTKFSDFVAARKRGGATNATIRRDLATLSCLFTCAITWDFIEINPVKIYGKRHLRDAPPRTSYPSDCRKT